MMSAGDPSCLTDTDHIVNSHDEGVFLETAECHVLPVWLVTVNSD